MSKRAWLTGSVVAILLVALIVGVVAYDSSQRNKIADGITIGGVKVGGLTASQARARLEVAFRVRLRRPIVARFHGHRFVLTARAAHLKLNPDDAIQQALDDSRGGWIVGRVFRSLTGGQINDEFAPQATFSRSTMDRLVAHAARSLNRSAHDATISYSGSSVGLVPQQTGVKIRTGALSEDLRYALSDPSQSRTVTIRAQVSHPHVTVGQLASRDPTVITVDRSSFQLRLWKHLKLAKTYPIAVGMIGLETPAGLYHVEDKQVDPSWFVPNSPWAGSLAGQVVPPGPADPLKARWMGLVNGAGIHGIDPSEYGTIGHNASHGCIRMTIPDVIELYDQTPVGTPVYIQ